MKNEPVPSCSTSSDMSIDKKLPNNLTSPAEEDMEIDELIRRQSHLSLVSPPETKFVINTIAYVPEREFCDDSSSEEIDGTFSDEDFNFDPKNTKSFPFTASRNLKIINFEELTNLNERDSTSTVIKPFLDKLSQNGFEKSDKWKLSTSISASIALNRMKSLSTRKNKSLDLELKSKENSDIRYEKFGFFWIRQWNRKGRSSTSVDQNKVKKFYKQLKKVNPKKAEDFIREMEEKAVAVPYQKLREYAKNHAKTKKLVQEFREKDHNANVYLSLIDSDVVDFNGIYSAYLRIVKGYKVSPTVMSTGYKYSNDEPAYQLASEIDRIIRVKTARHFPLGVYYPEPNACILIPENCDTLPESFIDKKRIKGNLESACLLKKVQNRQNATFVFSEDNPLITTIPDRARLNKISKSKLLFSREFVQGASPSENDVKRCKQVAQSSFMEYVWLTNLFINDGIKFRKHDLKDYVTDPEILKYCKKLYSKKRKMSEDRNRIIKQLKLHIPSNVVDVMVKKNAFQHCKSLISSIRSSELSTKERLEIRDELKMYIIEDDVIKVLKAIREVNLYIEKVEEQYIRSEDEEKLHCLQKKYNIPLGSIDRDKVLALAQQPVLELVEKNILNLQCLIKLDINILEAICYDMEIIEMLENKTMNYDWLVEWLKKNYSDFMEVNRDEYSFSDILEKYEENPAHIKFMSSEDPTEIVYLNSDDSEVVNCGIENYDIDIQWIKSELNGFRDPDDYDSADLMLFNSILDERMGKHEETDEESFEGAEEEYEGAEEEYEGAEEYVEGQKNILKGQKRKR